MDVFCLGCVVQEADKTKREGVGWAAWLGMEGENITYVCVALQLPPNLWEIQACSSTF